MNGHGDACQATGPTCRTILATSPGRAFCYVCGAKYLRKKLHIPSGRKST